MILTEWNTEDAIAFARQEEHEETTINIARNALSKGLPLEVIHDITGLPMETIKQLVESPGR